MVLRLPISLTAFLIVGFAPLAFAQPGGPANDTIKFHDRTRDGAETIKIGEIKETPAGIVVTSTGKSVTISPADVIAIYYGKMTGVDDKTRQELPNWDAKGGPEALAKYADLYKAASNAGADDRTKRFLEFKVAMWSAKIADGKTGDEFKAEAAAAIDKLNTVARAYSKSWEVWPVSRTAARLQGELGKYNAAAATLANLAKAEGVPAELRNEAKIAEVDALFRSGSALTAASAIETLAKAAGALNDSQKERLAIYQAAVKGAQEKTDPARVQAAAKEVRELIGKTNDPLILAAAHNALGELFLMANLPRDAQWEFLWVDTVYNHDREENLKALSRLCELFAKQGDKEHESQYREKLLKAKGA
jgi:hypothetical protein